MSTKLKSELQASIDMLDGDPHIEIEKGVPIPKSRTGPPAVYPFGKMEVGDSFLAPKKRTAPERAAYLYGQRHSKKFIARKTADGMRIWRIK